MQDSAGRDRPLGPQLLQLLSEVLRRQHVERGERLVEEEHLRMDDQRAGEPNALLHPAGQLLGEGLLVSVEADQVDRFLGARASLLPA